MTRNTVCEGQLEAAQAKIEDAESRIRASSLTEQTDPEILNQFRAHLQQDIDKVQPVLDLYEPGDPYVADLIAELKAARQTIEDLSASVLLKAERLFYRSNSLDGIPPAAGAEFGIRQVRYSSAPAAAEPKSGRGAANHRFH